MAGCTRVRQDNTAAWLGAEAPASTDGFSATALNAVLFLPARDIATLDVVGRAVGNDEAWNADGYGVPDSWVYTNRASDDLRPSTVAAGPCTMPPPKPPFTIVKKKESGDTAGFIGADALGRKFLFKLDHPEYPELSSSAEIIGSRLVWALGYNVPAVFITRIEGTSDPRLDGQRATASLFLDGAVGHFEWDWFRYRREIRALRLAYAWINETDAHSGNTLVVKTGDEARGYLLDFNGALGSWQGKPKEPWRGHRYFVDPLWLPLSIVSLTLLRAEGLEVRPVVSPAVGRFDANFDPMTWVTQLPNTAFERMTPADAAWMARKISRIGRAQIEATVAEAKLGNPADARYLVETLLARRQRILERVHIRP